MGSSSKNRPSSAAGTAGYGARRTHVGLKLWVADLTAFPLPPQFFHLVVCTRYLQRDLWPALRETIAPGGFILYETFTVDQLRYPTGPRSPDHLLRPGELRAAFEVLDVWSYEEVVAPAAFARLVARKRAA